MAIQREGAHVLSNCINKYNNEHWEAKTMWWDEELKSDLETYYLNSKVIDEVSDEYLNPIYGGIVNDYGGSIEVTLVSRPYLQECDSNEDEVESKYDDISEDECVDDESLEDDADEDEYSEEENWTVSHELTIDLDKDRRIVGFSISDNIWGDSGLGDYDPSEVYSRSEYFDSAYFFLDKIVISDSDEDDDFCEDDDCEPIE